MNLKIFHGRDTVDEQMDDWGYEGPTLTAIQWWHTTYYNEQRMKFATFADAEAAKQLTGWKCVDNCTLQPIFEGDCLVVRAGDGKTRYYGDWSLYDPELCDRDEGTKARRDNLVPDINV